MQAQIQALLAAQAGGAGGGGAAGSNTGSHMEVAKPAIFSRETGRVGGFITACRLYVRMKLRGNTVEEQVQWALTYVQGGSADVWKKNIMDEIEAEEVEFESVEEFFTCLKKEFGGGEEEAVKAAEEATIASTGNNRTCSDGRCREDKCSGSKRTGTEHRDSSQIGSLCYGNR